MEALSVAMRTCWNALQRGTIDVADSLAGLVLPVLCVACQTQIPDSTDPHLNLTRPRLCDRCRDELLDPDRGACQKCGAPIGPFVSSENGCLECRTRDFRFREVVRLGVYEGELRKVVIRGKGSDQQPLSAAIAECLVDQQRSRLESLQADFVTCVPRFWIKRMFQQHHQAETIAAVIASRLELPLRLSVLKKVRLTRDQSELPREQRLKNLADAFRVRTPQQVKDQTILLVDDVLTTGTTVNECTKSLRRAGAKRVIVVVLARVP